MLPKSRFSVNLWRMNNWKVILSLCHIKIIPFYSHSTTSGFAMVKRRKHTLFFISPTHSSMVITFLHVHILYSNVPFVEPFPHLSGSEIEKFSLAHWQPKLFNRFDYLPKTLCYGIFMHVYMGVNKLLLRLLFLKIGILCLIIQLHRNFKLEI